MSEPIKKKEPAKWRDSDAQLLLRQLIKSGEIPSDSKQKGPKAVWKDSCFPRPEFEGFLYEKFAPRLRAARERHITKSSNASTESIALARDRMLFPAPTHNHRGEPRWEGSDAERLLKVDINKKRHETMTPLELYRKRAEYYDNYKLRVFRDHIYQEVRLRKFVRQYCNR